MNNPGGSNKVGSSHIFYKTRMCAKFKQLGTCWNGEHCTFAHGVHDLREPPPNWQDLIFTDKERVFSRMKICRKYNNGEECPYGDRCNFLHQRPSHVVEQTEICTGDFDQKTTTFRKMRLCSNWEMGQCPFGEKCHFAHGHSELRVLGSPDVVENAGPAPKKTASVSAFTTPPVAAAPLNGDGDEKAKSKWKLPNKVNGIYGDWLDDLSPPRSLPEKEEI